jgi:hypothetical protein
VVAELGEIDAGDDGELPPPRAWLLENQFCRSFISGIVAQGSVGKTTLRLLQSMALATGEPLTGQRVYRRSRVLVITLEDDLNELRRRIWALRIHHGIEATHLKGWLFYQAKGLGLGRLMEKRDGALMAGTFEGVLRRAIERRRPDLVILDPFAKLHGANENDNNAMDQVIEMLAGLAHEYDIAIDSPAHVRKGAAAPGDADARRGASAVRDAGRLDYTLMVMEKKEAATFGIAPGDRRFYLRLDSAKVNLLPPAYKTTWFRLVSVPLGNCTPEYPAGDWAQAIEPWTPPDSTVSLTPEAIEAILKDIDAGMPNGSRYSGAASAKRRSAWHIVAKHAPDLAEEQCRAILRRWIEQQVLEERDYKDPVERKAFMGLFVVKQPNQEEAP